MAAKPKKVYYKWKPTRTPEERQVRHESKMADRIKAASCVLVVKFFDSEHSRTFWSNDLFKPKISANYWANHLRNLVDDTWSSKVETAAIFDTRVQKHPDKNNKLWQFENGKWDYIGGFEQQARV
jgi:hypothetical protein